MRKLISKMLIIASVPTVLFAAEYKLDHGRYSGFICYGQQPVLEVRPIFDLEGKTLTNNNFIPGDFANSYYAFGYSYPSFYSSYPYYVGVSLSYNSNTIVGNSLLPNLNISGSHYNYRLGCQGFYGNTSMSYLSNTTSPINVNNVRFTTSNRELSMWIPGTNWADIHLQINGGQQLNYRLTKNYDEYKIKLNNLNIRSGDKITFTVTAEKSENGAAYDSKKQGFEVVNIAPEVSISNTSTSISAYLTSSELAYDWAILHYSVNNAAYENVNMPLYSPTVAIYDFTTPIATGSVVKYFITYSANGVAKDSQVYSYTQN